MRRYYLAISKNSKKIISFSYKPLRQFPKFFSPIFAQNAQVCARVEGLFFMNYEYSFILLLVWSFTRLRRVGSFLTFIPFLAWSFCRIQGLGRIQNGSVPMYCEYLNLGSKRSSRKKKPLKRQIYEHFMQNEPNGMLFKPNLLCPAPTLVSAVVL